MPVIHHVDVPGYPAAHSPYSHAVVANGFVFVSGRIPMRRGGSPTDVAGDTMQEETRQALRNVETILKAAGSSLDRVVKVYLVARPAGPLQGRERRVRGVFPRGEAGAVDGRLRCRYPRRDRRHQCDRARLSSAPALSPLDHSAADAGGERRSPAWRAHDRSFSRSGHSELRQAPDVVGQIWPEAEQQLWSAQRQQADVRSSGLPPTAIDPKRNFAPDHLGGLGSRGQPILAKE
jgi:hypothetical protein